jgi:hypothetical protein
MMIFDSRADQSGGTRFPRLKDWLRSMVVTP